MQLSDSTISAICERFDWQWCSRYGEPGYGSHIGAGTTRVVLGYYWTRPGQPGWHPKLHDGTDRHQLWGLAKRWPRLFGQLEEQGVELEWADEWLIDYEHDKAYRTTGDSYSWEPCTVYDEYGDLLTPDSDLDDWLAWAFGRPLERPLNDARLGGNLTQWLAVAGFARFPSDGSDRFEAGWYPGQTDTPASALAALKMHVGHDQFEFVVAVDYVQQFDAGFSLYWRPIVKEDAA